MASELVAELVRVASEETGILEDAIWGQPYKREARRGRQDAAYARQAVWYALRERGWTLQAIADAFGRNHATVHHGIALIKQRKRSDRFCEALVMSLLAVAPDLGEEVAMTRAVGASIARIDRELVWARQLALELTQRIDALTAARGALMQVVDPVPTRGLQAVV